MMPSFSEEHAMRMLQRTREQTQLLHRFCRSDEKLPRIPRHGTGDFLTAMCWAATNNLSCTCCLHTLQVRSSRKSLAAFDDIPLLRESTPPAAAGCKVGGAILHK